MAQSGISRWRKTPIIVLVLLAMISITCITLVLNRSSSNLENFDMDLLNSYCTQHNYLTDENKATWSNTRNKSLKESEQVGHIYGEENQYKSSMKGQTVISDHVWSGLNIKGAIYMLVQENDLQSARATIRSIEDRFHSSLNTSYPYIILSSQLMKPDFKMYLRKAARNPEKVFFGQIDLEAWSYPYWIDSNRAENAFQRMKFYNIKKGHSPYYHHAQRYQSGLFVHHPLFDNVEYVWQVDAGSTYTCNMFQEDPFSEMKLNNKKIGFSLTNKDQQMSMYSIWPATLHYMKKRPELVQPTEDSIAPWLVNSKKEFNYCQMSSSFQILDVSFIKSEIYQDFFHYLDIVGGFYYERWTDSAIRTVAAALFLKKNEILYLDNIGVDTKDGERCPFDSEKLGSCTCDFRNSHELKKKSCTINLLKYIATDKLDTMFDFLEAMAEKEEEMSNNTT